MMSVLKKEMMRVSASTCRLLMHHFAICRRHPRPNPKPLKLETMNASTILQRTVAILLVSALAFIGAGTARVVSGADASINSNYSDCNNMKCEWSISYGEFICRWAADYHCIMHTGGSSCDTLICQGGGSGGGGDDCNPGDPFCNPE